MKKKVVLLVGGLSAEREVSLSTGRGFENALKELGYPYEVIDAKEDLLERLTKAKADVALLALHGKYAEDGVVQGICEYLKLPYSGSGVLASALCMDKIFTKEILVNHDIPTPKHQLCDFKKQKPEQIKLQLKLPVVVKPSREGSSVGVSIVKEEKDFLAALKYAGQHDHYIIIEEYIPGLEITVPILNDKALTPIEIAPKVDFYDYKNKYTAGRTEYHLPPRVNAKTISIIQEQAMKAFHACRVRGYGRIDFRVTPEGLPFVIEINTLPGCTPTSLLPKSAAHEGISFNQLVETLVETAALDYEGVK